MVKVAVAGGTGGVGRTIVEAILATKKHEVIVLSRSSNSELEARGITVIPVSYTDPSSLEAALKGVHTIICTMVDFTSDSAVKATLALLDAAKKAGIKRFSPSGYGPQFLPGDADHPIKVYGYAVHIHDVVKESGLEYTWFVNGMFMNYLAISTPGLGDLRAMGGTSVNVPNCTALIPGDGSAKMVFTRVEDAAAYVAASLDLPKWPEYSFIVGDKKSWGEVLALAEAVRGKKFDVTYISEEEIQKRIDPNAANPLMNLPWFLMLETLKTDRFNWDANMNDLCPEVKPMGVEEFLKKWWGNSQA